MWLLEEELNMRKCPHCLNSLEQRLIETAAGFFCPTCGKVIQFAKAMASQPTTTAQERGAWEGVAMLALIFAGAVALDRFLES
jgi:hypothetical protein